MLDESVRDKGYALLCVSEPRSDCRIRVIDEVRTLNLLPMRTSHSLCSLGIYPQSEINLPEAHRFEECLLYHSCQFSFRLLG
jgi:hypothetical protein